MKPDELLVPTDCVGVVSGLLRLHGIPEELIRAGFLC
jgi:hypothetical protein